MSYQVIARKWRPQKFEDVTGQEVLTQTLQNAIAHDRLHHAYLFSGARGVGKTTTARLVARALNCHKSDKPTATPCSIIDATACASCREIAEGDRKSTRLNSSHVSISYAVFCLKKKKNQIAGIIALPTILQITGKRSKWTSH